MLVVQKYGGTSLATPGRIRSAAKRIAQARQKGERLVVVVSAMGHTTDHLIRLARKTVSTPPARELDMLLTSGERVSMSLLAMALEELGVKAISFTGSQSGIVTDCRHTEARIVEIRPHRILEELGKGKVVIIAGFQGVSPGKEITTLGRGGSDTTAVALSAALKADRCVVFTDVDGLFTADPRIVNNARLLRGCSYDVALELASLGAKMHPRSLVLAKKFGVPVSIASSFEAGTQGTLIGEGDGMESTRITGITSQKGFCFFETSSTLSDIATIAQANRCCLRFLYASSKTVSFLCENECADVLGQALTERGLKVRKMSSVAVVSAVGEGAGSDREVFAKSMDALRGIKVLLLCTNSLSLSVAIAEKDLRKAAQSLHDHLIS
jgi:aspartate kinase